MTDLSDYRRRSFAANDALSTVDRACRTMAYLEREHALDLSTGHPTEVEAQELIARLRAAVRKNNNTLNNYVRDLNRWSRFYGLRWKLSYFKRYATPMEDYLTDQDEARLRAARWSDPSVDMRNRALIALELSCGLRRQEVQSLKLTDLITLKSGTRAIRVLRGKGQKPRTVYPDAETWTLLDSYVTTYRQKTDRESLFTGPRGALGYNYLGNLASKIGKHSGVAGFHWHAARHRMIDAMLDEGVGIAVIQEVAGHSRPETTIAYASRRNVRKFTEREVLSFQERRKRPTLTEGRGFEYPASRAVSDADTGIHLVPGALPWFTGSHVNPPRCLSG